MFTHILIATDGSELADKAVDQGLALAAKLGTKVTAVTVTLPWVSTASGEWPMVFPIEDYERAAAATAQRILGAVAEKAKAARVACDTVHVNDQYAAEGIVEAAKNRNSSSWRRTDGVASPGLFSAARPREFPLTAPSR